MYLKVERYNDVTSKSQLWLHYKSHSILVSTSLFFKDIVQDPRWLDLLICFVRWLLFQIHSILPLHSNFCYCSSERSLSSPLITYHCYKDWTTSLLHLNLFPDTILEVLFSLVVAMWHRRFHSSGWRKGSGIHGRNADANHVWRRVDGSGGVLHWPRRRCGGVGHSEARRPTRVFQVSGLPHMCKYIWGLYDSSQITLQNWQSGRLYSSTCVNYVEYTNMKTDSFPGNFVIKIHYKNNY